MINNGIPNPVYYFCEMDVNFYKYQGAGNDFVMIDNRARIFNSDSQQLISSLCDRRFGIGADGLILIQEIENADFEMLYFNADGGLGSMCGNGGRCAVAFARFLGIVNENTSFLASDGVHTAKISAETVSLSMGGVSQVIPYQKGSFLNTGSPHFVVVVPNVEHVDVMTTGAELRHDRFFGKGGTNVNFVEIIDENRVKIRTFERGVEAETFACGTGAVAAAIAIYRSGKKSSQSVVVEARGGILEVCFDEVSDEFKNVILTGPALQVFKGMISI